MVIIMFKNYQKERFHSFQILSLVLSALVYGTNLLYSEDFDFWNKLFLEQDFKISFNYYLIHFKFLKNLQKNFDFLKNFNIFLNQFF